MSELPQNETAAAALEFGERLLAREREQAQAALLEQRAVLRQHNNVAMERAKDIARALERMRADARAVQVELAEARGQVDAVTARLDAVTAQLAAIETSATWRIARRLREFVSAHPVLERLLGWALRVALRLVLLTRKRQSVPPEAVRAEPATPEPVASLPACAPETSVVVDPISLPPEAATGWLGGRPVSFESPYLPRAAELRAERTDAVTTLAGYNTQGEPDQVAQLRAVAPLEAIASALRSRRARATTSSPSEHASGYTIVTVIGEASRSYRRTVSSVQALVEQAAQPLQWIVVDVRRSTDEPGLSAALSEQLAPITRIIVKQDSDEPAGLNEARRAASADWLLLLDCGDELETCALSILDERLRQFPDCRFLSCSEAQLFADEAVAGWQRNGDPSRVFEDERAIGALMLIRCDLFDDIGGFRSEHAGAHRYDFALRAALREPLLSIPDFLYRRWLPEIGVTDPIDGIRTANVLRDFLRAFSEICDGTALVRPPARSDPSLGLCIIRTSGERLDLLEEVVASARSQQVPVSVCVVVDAGADAMADVRRRLGERKLDAAIVTTSNVPGRVHPFNVGLEYLREHSSEYGFCFFLDDRSVAYPFFASRLVDLLMTNNCDIAVSEIAFRPHARAARRGRHLLPVFALAASSFMSLQGCIIRVSTLVRNEWRFDEQLEHLGDWDFLATALEAGASFACLPEVLCEIGIDEDGPLEELRPIQHAMARERLLERTRRIASRLGPRWFVGHLAEFDFFTRPVLAERELRELHEARTMYFGADAG